MQKLSIDAKYLSKQAEAELGQAQQLVSQLGDLFSFWCQRRPQFTH